MAVLTALLLESTNDDVYAEPSNQGVEAASSSTLDRPHLGASHFFRLSYQEATTLSHERTVA